ncbi:MAG: hypothetical protein WKF57_15475 [Nakamurella sp.]
MDASRTRMLVTRVAATLAALLAGQGVAGAAPSTGSSAPSSVADLTGDAVAPSPFQGVPSWLLIVVGIVVIAFAIRVVARRDEGNPGRGGGRDRGSSDPPRRPFRPD